MASEAELKKKLQLLEERLEYLEEQKRFSLDLLENASSLGDFQSTFAQMQDPTFILAEAASRMQRFLPVRAQAFMLVDEASSDFQMTLCVPLEDAAYMDENATLFIDKGVFAWALREKRPVFMTANDGKTRFLLHVLSTSARVRGMFLAAFPEGCANVYDHALALLSILLLHTANALESYELYRWVRRVNTDLEAKLQDLANSEQELKLHRNRLETLVTERTQELDQTVEQLKLSVQEKQSLLNEIHHRVRNNLQVISSLLNLQANKEASSNCAEALHSAQGRVRSMALIHEHLHKDGQGGRINLKYYLANLSGILLNRGAGSNAIHLDLDMVDAWVEMDTAMPLGLAANELVGNSLRHAFADGRPGRVRLAYSQGQRECTLSVRDDGVGLPKEIDPEKPGSLGLMLVSTLAAQLGGYVRLTRLTPGTDISLVFPAAHPPEKSQGAVASPPG